MRLLVLLAAMLAALPAMSQDCAYKSGDGLSVTFSDGGNITIESGSENAVCEVRGTEFQMIKSYHCGAFSGDLYMIPSESGALFPDILFMPPNALYWDCR